MSSSKQRDNALKSINAHTNYGISPPEFEEAIEELPEIHADVLRWWYFHGKENQLSFSKLAKLAGVHGSTLSRVFRGVYNADLTSICDTLEKAKSTVAGRADNPDFIMTSLARRMFSIFDATRSLGIVTIMWGKMGIGKTITEENYKARNNHGRTIYYRCGSAMAFGTFLGELATAMGIVAKNRNYNELRSQIKKLLRKGQRLLIIDELHELFIVCRPDVALKICEFLRELHDDTKCALVLVGTPVLKKHLYEGAHKEILSQLVDRGRDPIILPSKFSRQDILAILDHYGLTEPAATDAEAAAILGDLIATASLRKITIAIRAGASAATIADEKYTWAHFVAAHQYHAGLAKIDEEEKQAA